MPSTLKLPRFVKVFHNLESSPVQNSFHSAGLNEVFKGPIKNQEHFVL